MWIGWVCAGVRGEHWDVSGLLVDRLFRAVACASRRSGLEHAVQVCGEDSSLSKMVSIAVRKKRVDSVRYPWSFRPIACFVQ